VRLTGTRAVRSPPAIASVAFDREPMDLRMTAANSVPASSAKKMITTARMILSRVICAICALRDSSGTM
jgi:hypothetical protein